MGQKRYSVQQYPASDIGVFAYITASTVVCRFIIFPDQLDNSQITARAGGGTVR